MKKSVIAVCDTEGEYACSLAEYFNSRKKLPFEAEAFTNVEKLRDYAGKNPPEILLISQEDADEQIGKLGAENVILLTEEPQEEDGYKCVYKYQSAESVIQEVMAYYAENTAPAFYSLTNRKTDIIGVYSPVNRCSKTMLALTIGQILGEKKSVLYLNMEDYSGFETLFHLAQEQNLTDLFYLFRCKEQIQPGEIERYVKPLGHMECIPPAGSPEDIRAIQFAEWMKLFQLIQSGKRYEVILLDLGNSVDQLFKILGLCHCIYAPVQEDYLSRCKWMQFQKILEQWGGIEEHKIRELRLPMCCPNLEDPGFLHTLVWGKWGDYVRKVLEADGKR